MLKNLKFKTKIYLRFIAEIIRSRPLVLPVILAVLTGISCFSFKSAFAILLVMIVFALFLILEKEKSRELVIILTVSVTTGVYVGYKVLSVYESQGYSDVEEAVVVSVITHFSGENEIIVMDSFHNRILVNSEEDFDVGMKVVVSGIREPDTSRNPGSLDYRDYLYRRNIRYTAKSVSILEDASGYMSLLNSFTDLCNRMRFTVFNRVTAGLDEKSRALAGAVFLGDKSLLDAKDKYVFQHSGCAHILAVSGTHISSFLLIIPYVLDKSVRNRKKRAFIYSLFCLLLGCITGWSESVTRACLMSICSYSSRDYLSGMSFSALILIITNPFTVLSTGFQMSYMASLGIYLLSPLIISKCKDVRVNENVKSTIASYLAVQISMLPFFTVSGTHLSVINTAAQFINNALAGIACVLFIPTVIVYPVPLVRELFIMVSTRPLTLIRYVSGIASKAMKYSLNIRSAGKTVIVLGFLWIIVFFLNKSDIRKTLCRILSCVTVVVIVVNVLNNLNNPKTTVVFIDVGQGDSCLVISGGKSCLIDTGVSDTVIYNVIPVLDYYGIDCIDYCIATHWDLDHAGGIGVLYELGRIDKVYSACDNVSADVLSEWNGTKVEISVLHTGDSIVLSEETYFDVLSPYVAYEGDNEESLVLMLTADSSRILFTGDIGNTTEMMLIESAADIDSDILKVGHHGSRYSTCQVFVDSVSPQIAVISVGANNFYGHPTEEVINRLGNSSCEVYRTDYSGAIICAIDGYGFRVSTWR